MIRTVLTGVLVACLASAVAAQDVSKAPADAKVMILEPADGAEVSSPLTVKFGISGMEIAPAGTDKPNSGHHHLIIDSRVDDLKNAIPADDAHKHFGKGQTDTTLDLKPGKHTLQLVLGDKNHIPHDPVVQSAVITITVK